VVHNYRNRIDIIVSILEVTNGNEVRQTEILNKANITHTIFKEHISILLQYGLIEYVALQETYYKTTAKGLDYLSICNKMKALILPPPDLSSESSIPTISKIPTYPIHVSLTTRNETKPGSLSLPTVPQP